MLREHIEARGIRDHRVLEAMNAVPRERFVPPELHSLAYDDSPMPIGEGQTISQPYIVALMLDALELRGPERVLEVGTGSGYAAAVLSLLAAEVHTVERIATLAQRSRRTLLELGYKVHVHQGDGTLGWPAAAPYDAIVVAASGPRVPDALIEQLVPGGRLVIPIREEDRQLLLRVVRVPADGIRAEALEEVRFVPLIGAQGEPVEPHRQVG